MNYKALLSLGFVSALSCSISMFSVVDSFTYKQWEEDCKKGNYDAVLAEHYSLHNMEGSDRQKMLDWRSKRVNEKFEMPFVWAMMNYWTHHLKNETDSGMDIRRRHFLRTCLATYGRLLLDSFAVIEVKDVVKCPIVELFRERIQLCFDNVSISKCEFLSELSGAKLIINNKLNNDFKYALNASLNASSELPRPEIVFTARKRDASFWLKGTPSLECGSEEERQEAKKHFPVKAQDLSKNRKAYLDQVFETVGELRDVLVTE